MTIDWVEAICNKGGFGANDRALLRKMADEIYRLYAISGQEKFEILYNDFVSLQAQVELLKDENASLQAQLETKIEEITGPEITVKKRGRPSKKHDTN